MLSYTKKQLETIINNNDIEKGEINEILKNIIEKVDIKKDKINKYSNLRYKESTKDKEPTIRKNRRPYNLKKNEEDKKTTNMKEYRQLYYLANKEKMKNSIKANREKNKEQYNQYQKAIYQKRKQEQGNLTA